MRNRCLQIIVLLTLALFQSVPHAQAVCSSPAGNAGDMKYNGDFQVMQYCNDTNWQQIGPSPQGSGPTQIVPSGLVGHWKLDEISGTSIIDYASTNNGTVQGGLDPATDSVNGRIGTALDFDGGNDAINLGQMPSIVGSSTISLSFWMNPDSLPSSGGNASGLVAQMDDWDNVIGCRFDSNDEHLWCYVEIANVPSTTKIPYTYLSTNVWQFVTYTFNSGTSNIYLNGNLVDTNSSGSTTSIPDLTNNMYVGFAEVGPGFYYNGKIDDIRVYNRALAADEVRYLYESFDRNVK